MDKEKKGSDLKSKASPSSDPSFFVENKNEEKLKHLEILSKEKEAGTKKIIITEDENSEKEIPPLNIKAHIDEAQKEAQQIEEENKAEIEPEPERVTLEAEREVKKKSSRIVQLFYATFLIVNIVGFSVILWIIADQKIPFSYLMPTTESRAWFFVACCCFFAGMFIETFRFFILILKSTKTLRALVSYKAAAIGKYFDCITPLASGGQAHQISYFSKNGIKGSVASSLPVTKNVFAKFCSLLFILILLLFANYNFNIGEIGGGIVTVFAYIGLAFQLLVLIVVFTLSTSKRIGPAVTIGILKLAKKLKLIKNYRKIYVRVLRFVNDYVTSMRSLFKDFFNFLIMFSSSLLVILLRALIPFFLFCAFEGFDASQLVPIIVRLIVCELAMGIWILPGNVIFADLAFLTVFRPVFFSGGTLFWALLFWRILSYYAYVVQGWFVIGIDKIKYDWLHRPRRIPKSKNTN